MGRRDPHDFYDRLSDVLRRVRVVAEDAYASLEIGRAQAKLLMQIGKTGRVSQADLARATETAPTLTGRALEPLVARGWVRRKRSEEDRREYVVELTASGRRARERVEKAREAIIARIGRGLDDTDIEDFDRIANKVLSALEHGHGHGRGD